MFWDITCDYDVVLLPIVLFILYLAAVVLSVTTTGVYFQYRKTVLPLSIINAHLAFCIVSCVVYFLFSSVMWLWSAKYSLSRPMRNWRLCAGIWGMCLFKDIPLLIVEACAILRTGWHDSGLQAATFIIQIVFAMISIVTTSLTYSWYVAGFLDRNFGTSTETIVPGHGRGRIPYAMRMAAVAAAGRPPPLLLQESRVPIARLPLSAPVSRAISPRRSPEWEDRGAQAVLRMAEDSTSPYRFNRYVTSDADPSAYAAPELPLLHCGPPPII